MDTRTVHVVTDADRRCADHCALLVSSSHDEVAPIAKTAVLIRQHVDQETLFWRTQAARFLSAYCFLNGRTFADGCEKAGYVTAHDTEVLCATIEKVARKTP